MYLRERATAWIAGIVVGTAVLVITAERLGGTGSGKTVWIVLAVVVSIVVAAASWHATMTLPMRGQVERLAARLRRWGDGGEPKIDEVDPDLDPLSHALTEATTEVDARRAALLQRMAVLEDAIQASSFGLAIINDEGLLTDVNDEFRKMFRLRGPPEGRLPLEAIPSVEIHLVIQEAQAHGSAEHAFATGSSDLVARADALGSGVLIQVQDVTGTRDAERSRTDFVANVSHELRTPLGAILGYLETLLHDADRIPADLLAHLETVDRNARRLRDLFEDLLRLHRIESRRRNLPLVRQPLRPILQEAVGPAADQASMREQSFSLVCPDALQAVVNPEALAAIVGNLAANASSYTPEGGNITVRASRADSGVVQIDVVDDGIGIALPHHERIFERFYRVDDARSRRAGGTGLGLAIVKHYALACGFHLELESEKGQGTTFSVLLFGGES